MPPIYVDHNDSFDTIGGLRVRGHVAVTAREAGLDRASDDVQLLTAARRGLILLTCNRRDFRLLHDAWRRWSAPSGVTPTHAGIVLFPQEWPVARAIDE